MTYESHENPDILQRELVEATQQLIITQSTKSRAETELSNAEAQEASAQEKVDDLTERYSAAQAAARGVTAAPVAGPKREAPPKGAPAL